LIILLELIPERPFSVNRAFSACRLGPNIYAGLVSLLILFYGGILGCIGIVWALGQTTLFLGLVFAGINRSKLFLQLFILSAFSLYFIFSFVGYSVEVPPEITQKIVRFTSVRWSIMMAFWESLKEMPFYGYGLMEWNFLCKKFFEEAVLGVPGHEMFKGTHRYLHNSFAELMAAYGVLSLPIIASLMWLLVSFGRWLSKGLDVGKVGYVFPAFLFVLFMGGNIFFSVNFLFVFGFISNSAYYLKVEGQVGKQKRLGIYPCPEWVKRCQG
jgi:hypothetical protein